MGDWGTGLFECDLAADIEGQFLEDLDSGMTPKAAADRALRENADSLADEDDRSVVLLAVASLLLDAGVREHTVYAEAREAIRTGDGLERYAEAGAEDLVTREQVYRELGERIEHRHKLRRKRRPRRKRVGVGDVIQIPLSDGRYGYVHCVLLDQTRGYLVEVLDCRTTAPAGIEQLGDMHTSLPPFFVFIQEPVDLGRWQVIGHQPVKDYAYPRFLMPSVSSTGHVGMWRMWDGERETRLGPGPLPQQCRNWPFLSILFPEALEIVIQTGRDEYAERIWAAEDRRGRPPELVVPEGSDREVAAALLSQVLTSDTVPYAHVMEHWPKAGEDALIRQAHALLTECADASADRFDQSKVNRRLSELGDILNRLRSPEQ